MVNHLLAEFMGTALMIIFGVGVHCDEVLKKTKYAGSGHLFAITTWAFGISVVLFIFGGVCINPAMALTQAILGMIPWSYFIPYTIAEVLGGVVGAVIVYIMYADHFKESEGSIDPIAIRNIFSTNPNLRNLPRNYFVETFATFVFLTSILAIVHGYDSMSPIAVGLLVWAIGMGLGGTTGFAMNQARDLGPRLAFQLLPIKNKANNDWQYGLIVPGTAPFVGSILAAAFVRFYLHIY
ncbi:D/L-lactic acid transporter LarD [Pediococcus pentosaceus]|jgi:glycerol uptake facilitator protein|uniref:Aquaporin family protein n=3 Tax=Pediococcus pentosaceus TaxID=1255 RepID=A0A0R2HJ18_PEDPE|nr:MULTISPECIES: D/L-lactic acid transporter LarD [Pediococcus]ABJ68712.1 Glycerol uptake facilitator related permease (Major Intrinsic Protein Family) [Pediococcus pentosaceus ATCC 25745]AHA05728.1 glycerol transporter [Pediococcus pentosaceus SL4]ANI97292.1 glycerol transporter [Pediococcus pentosaceus]ARW18921.1 Glycerol uptake facilitator protein [Pediococcus pentosaceus]ASC07780.1 Glycerol uptake facilitator protein [Pediococcus pentosaceus]